MSSVVPRLMSETTLEPFQELCYYYMSVNSEQLISINLEMAFDNRIYTPVIKSPYLATPKHDRKDTLSIIEWYVSNGPTILRAPAAMYFF